MKTFISLFIVACGATGLWFSTEAEDHRSCTCSGTFCSCSTTCLDKTEIPNCACGVFSCICKCDPKDATHPNDIPVPTINSDQEINSKKAEGYFRDLGGSDQVKIADAIKALREAIQKGDSYSYLVNSGIAESTYSALPDSQKLAWENWSLQNLKR